jgi:plasmid stabilization system protein ParE
VKPVRLIHEAETELWQAVLYYEEQQGGLGAEFVHEVRSALQMIQRAPEMWPARARGMRRYLIARFPFLVHYRVESERVLVVAIAHGHRKPGYWTDRIR